MRRGTGTALLAAILLAAAGCGGADPGGGADAGAVEVLAKAEGWRDSLQETTGHLFLLVEVADDPELARRAWDDNAPDDLPEASGEPAEPGVYRPLDEVDLDDRVLVVYSSGESGTCPAWVEHLSVTDGTLAVELDTVAGEACTDDVNPYRLLLAVDRGVLPLDDLPIERVDVPSENLEDVAGRAVVYPAGGS